MQAHLRALQPNFTITYLIHARVALLIQSRVKLIKHFVIAQKVLTQTLIILDSWA